MKGLLPENALIILHFLLGLCSGLVFDRAAGRVMTRKEGFFYTVARIAVYFIAFINISWIGDENPIIFFPFFMAAFLLCYRAPWCARLVCGMIFFSLIEPFCMMTDSSALYKLDNNFGVVALSFFKLAFCLVIYFVLRRMLRGRESLYLPPKFWGLLGGLAAAPLFSTLSFTFWRANDFGNGLFDYYHIFAYPIAYTILPFVILSSMVLLFAASVLSRHEELEQRQKIAEAQQAYYNAIQREQAGVRMLRHDMRNHISVAQGLLERRETEAAESYLRQLVQLPAFAGGSRYCENEMANALISGKVSLMEQYAITGEIQAALPEELPLSDVELCALIGNSLDNAIEAAKDADEKRISMRTRSEKGMLALSINNTCGAAPQQENGRFITTKENATDHGYGIGGMKEIAQRHGGVCEAEYEGGEFRLRICIPLTDFEE